MKKIRIVAIAVALATVIQLACGRASAEPASTADCRVVRQGKHVELDSPHFVFRLDTASGLRAQSWQNRQTDRTLPLAGGPELEFDLGLPEGPLKTPRLEVSKVEVNSQGETGEAVFRLDAKQPAATAVVTYRWDAKQPLLHKFVEIVNQGGREWNRLLNVRLGRYNLGDVPVIDKPAGGTYSVPAPREVRPCRGISPRSGLPSFPAQRS